MIRTLSRRLMNVSCSSLVMSVGCFIVATIWGAIRAVAGLFTQPTAFAVCVACIFLSLFVMAIAWALGHWADELDRTQARRTPSQTIPFAPMEKPAGFNRAVLHHFHEGPELRIRDEEFTKGFAARAQVPPPKAKRDPTV